jgi:ABC-type Fe3+/spermidine/putrescine transport system ATPase subunit
VKLDIEGLSVEYGQVAAVHGLNLTVGHGELVALVGPSGCGKTTTLGFITGFIRAKAGRVLFDGVDVTSLSPQRRGIGYVFQDYAIYPHMTVRENIRFPLDAAKKDRKQAERDVDEIAGLMGVGELLARRPHQLSGGQRQRVALARALVKKPVILLLDEPLSNLDPTLRERTRHEIRDLIHRVGITTVLVTHEQDEAFELGDRVAVMRGGRLEQVGTPDELYGAPASVFIGSFVGRSSAVEVTVLGPTERGARIALEGVEWDVDGVPRHPLPPPGRALMLVRPEALRITQPEPAAVPATVIGRRFVGPSAIFTVRTDGGAVLEVVAPPQAVPAGARVGLMPSRRVGGGIHLFPSDGP